MTLSTRDPRRGGDRNRYEYEGIFCGYPIISRTTTRTAPDFCYGVFYGTLFRRAARILGIQFQDFFFVGRAESEQRGQTDRQTDRDRFAFFFTTDIPDKTRKLLTIETGDCYDRITRAETNR